MSRPQPYAFIPRAPEGTKTNTLWIWLIVLLPVVQLIPLLFINWASLIDYASLSSVNSVGLITSPAYLLSGLGGWVVYGLCALFAYLDWKQLKVAGVPVPFHFAWVFLSSLVYIIGRSVVVHRRTGRGLAPLWAAVASLVLSFAVAIYISVSVVGAVLSTVTHYR
jgi:hypothetical protein